MDPMCRAWLEIDLKNIVWNLRAMAKRVAPCRLLAVVKGNAYGMGVREVAAAAVKSAVVSKLGVAGLSEALELSDIPLPKQLISSVLPAEIPEAIHHGIVLPIDDLSIAAAIDAEAARQKKTAVCEIKVDTGMGRLGVPLFKARETIAAIHRLPNLRITGILSHMPCAGVRRDEFTLEEIAGFKSLISDLGAAGITFENVHCAASDAIVNYPESWSAPFTMVRPGTAIYGACFSRAEDLPLRPAVSFKGRLVAVRELPAGHTLGYSRLFKLQRQSRLGVVAAGYCDGVKIPLTNRGYVLINGKYCPVAGRVSMDYTTVLLGPDTVAEAGDEAVFIGRQGDAELTVEDMTQLNGTVTQDILCSFSPRVRRTYIR